MVQIYCASQVFDWFKQDMLNAKCLKQETLLKELLKLGAIGIFQLLCRKGV